MSVSVSPTANGEEADSRNESLPSPAPATGEGPAGDASPRSQGESQQQQQQEGAAQGDAKGLATPIHSAMKGKSGRERSTDMKPRFNPEVSVIETPSYVLVMNNEESGDEAEELAVFNRLYEEAKSRLERSKAAAAAGKDGEVEDPDAKECTFSPVVSDYAKQLGKYARFEEFLQSQEERRKMSAMHFSKKKEKVLSDDRVPLFEDMPRKHSLRIIAYLEKERKYKGPIKGWRERFRAYMKKLQERDQELTPNKSKTPASTPSVHSGIVRDDAVFDRLYDEAFVRAVSQRVVAMTQLEKEHRELYRPMTNETEYWGSDGHGNFVSPSKGRSNSRGSSSQRLSSRGGRLASANSDSMGSVFEELYAKSEEYRRRREIRAMEAMENQEEFPFRPVTNPESSRIIMERAIARAKGELPERAARKQRPGAADDNDGSESHSRERRSNIRFNPDIFCSRLQRKESERLKRLAELRRQLRMDEASECTFRPSISRNSQLMAMQKGYGQITFAPASHFSPRHPRHHAAGSEEGDQDYNDFHTGGGDDGSNTPQRGIRRHHQQRKEETPRRGNGTGKANGNAGRGGGGGAEVPVGRALDPEEVAEGYISALSSEIQGVLSQWTEAAEQARATT